MVTTGWGGQNNLVKIDSRQALDMLGFQQDPSWFRHDHLPYKIWFRVKGPRNQVQSPASTDEEIENVAPGSLFFTWWALVYSSHCPPISFPVPPFTDPHPPLLPTPAACAGLVLFLKTWTSFLPVNWVISFLAVTSNVLYSSTLIILQEAFLNNSEQWYSQRDLITCLKHNSNHREQKPSTTADPTCRWTQHPGAGHHIITDSILSHTKGDDWAP